MSDSLQPHGLQHPRLPCPSPTPGCYANSCPLSQWCHRAISSSVVPLSSRLQSSLASGCFPVSWFYSSGGQTTGVFTSASVLPMNIQDWFPFGLTSWISLQFSIRSYTLPSGGPLRKSRSTAGLHGSVCQRGHKQFHLHSLAMRVNQILQVSVFGGSHLVEIVVLTDTIHHFPTAEFQRVMVESLSLALGPQRRIERR